MTLLAKLGIGLGSYMGFNVLERVVLLSNSFNRNDKLTQPRATSIVIPAYNEERYISNTLNSLMEQNIIQKYPEMFEIIVVDNGSTDNTINIAKQYPIRVKQDARRGKLYAKDTGIRDAKGEIIMCFDSDTLYPPNVVNTILKSFNEDKLVVGVGGINFYDGIGHLLIPGGIWIFMMPYMIGSNQSFLKEYYLKNPFNLDVNQMTLKDIILEEERDFARRLAKYGKVVKSLGAASISSCRRINPFADWQFTKEVQQKQRFGEMIEG